MQRRLLIIIDELELGGTQSQIIELVRHIDRSRFDVTVAYFRNESSCADALRQAGAEVRRIDKRGRIDIVFFWKLCRFVRAGDFDIVHAFSFSGEVWGWLANAVVGHARFVSSARSTYDWYSPMQWTIKGWVTRGSAALIANSRAGAECAAMNMRVRSNRVHIVHNGIQVSDELVDMARRRCEHARSADRVLFLGRLVGHKNVSCLLRAFGRIAAQRGEVMLDIVGDGPMRASLEHEAASLGLDGNVVFHGEQDVVLPFLERADMLVCTSHREGLSNAIMEAMCAGLPVIASNVGGNSELVLHGETGLLFPADDDESLAAAILELLDSPEMRHSMGREGHTHMRRHHDPRRMASEIEQIYERCLVSQGACTVER